MLNEEDYIDLTNVDPKKYKEIFGRGYRYCCYKTEHQHGVILFFGYDANGNPQNYKIPHKSHIKYNVKYKTNEKDIYGRYVETRYFDTAKQRTTYLNGFSNKNLIIECLPPQNEFLHQYFDEYALDESFNTYPLRIHYYDIETEISDEGFENASTARQRINMITIYDTKTEKYYTWSLQPVTPDFSDEYDENGNIVNECCLKDTPLDKFVIFDFFNDSEARMLSHFLDWFEHNHCDVLLGFNSQAFDLGYILNRIERVLGDPDKVDNKPDNPRERWSSVTKRFSPVGSIRERHNNLDNERANKQAEYLYDVDGIFSADELILFKEKYKILQPLDGGNGLDNIGEVVCGIHKIHYKGTKAPDGSTIHSLKDLYLKDWNRFYKYNVMDVEVLRRVEEKVKTIPLSRAITSCGLSNYDAIYSSIGYLIGSLIMFSKTQMGTTFISYVAEKKQTIPYEGAFVFEVTPGLYTGGVATVDFNSLYPSSIRAMNLSPETYVGKISRFPIEDPTMEAFTKEPAIDLNGTDIIDGLFETAEEQEYNLRYSKKYGSVVKDKDLKQFYLLPANGSQQKIITREQLDKLLETKCIFTRNNTLFLKHSVKQGVVSGWCKHFYALRKKTKKLMQSLEMDVYNKKVPEDQLDAVEKKIANLNDRQQSIKIMINSIYGICGTSFSPIYNPYIAQSITRTGKFCNLSAAKYISKVFKERYNLKDDYVYQNGGDTDSGPYHQKIRIQRTV